MEKEAEIYRAEQFRGSCTVMLQRVSTCPVTGMQNDRSAELKRGLWRLNPLTAAVSSVLFIAAHQHNICNYQISPESSLPQVNGHSVFSGIRQVVVKSHPSSFREGVKSLEKALP